GSVSTGRGSRMAPRRPRRTHGLPGTLGMTLLAALFPGSGYLYAGRRLLGAVVLVGWLAVVATAVWYVGLRGTTATLEFAFDPTRLKIAALVIGLALLTWAFVVFTSYRLVRPRHRPRWHTVLGNLAVAVLCLSVAAPSWLAARASLAHADAISSVFDDDNNESATTPRNVSKEDPWGGEDRVNVLLLGGDGGEDRTGVRTDTVIVLSMNTKTGRTAMFSLPRNMMNAQFPQHSPLHDLYPDGYSGYEDDGFYMLNAIYGQIPERHPGVLGDSDNEGADALKQAVGGSLGIPVHYYVLVNLAGFREIVDALGGVTVNINEPVAINGNTDAGIPPTDYLDPGPNQHLDGFEALWFSRGRYGSDDYERMERQRCMIDAIIEAANPVNLFRRYTDLAAAGQEIVFTDIPLELAPAFVKLALKVKDAKIKSVVFRSSEKFNSGDPDFDYMRDTVQKTLHPPARKPGAKPHSEAVEPVDVCAYNPDDDIVEASE
ncbi:MAG: LCP family protein, partial [Actinomycetota bacterium]|nr:LCP family protein [Actinomycetota bacterium]